MSFKLELQNISLKNSNQFILQDINEMILPGETIAIVGPSGCGKTTLLKVIAGLQEPDTGHIFYNDNDLYKMRNKDFIELQKNTGFIFQDGALVSNLSLEDNIMLPLSFSYKKIPADLKSKINELIMIFDLEKKLKLRPANLSVSHQKLGGFIRGIALQPDLLFFDSPLSNVSKINHNQVIKIIQELRDKGSNIIIATENLDFCSTYSDRIFLMQEGKIIATGNKETIFQQKDEEIVKTINELEGTNNHQMYMTKGDKNEY